MIRYLEKEEYQKCRSLWQEAFYEDSEEFQDYYFNRKIADSRILVKENEEGLLLSMVHLNPYQVLVKDRLWQLDYIVGVATRADSRHQGHMRDILGKLLSDMHREGKPFCYLMPASPDIYRPFDFEDLFDQRIYAQKYPSGGSAETAGGLDEPVAGKTLPGLRPARRRLYGNASGGA
jgi:hypothetical protein